MCGKVNPPTNVMCESCGARLVPLAAPASDSTVVKPGAAPSQPTSPPTPPSPDDWLSNLRGTLTSAPQEEDVPDWLRGDQAAPSEPEPSAFDLNERLGGSEPAQVPDWLKGISSAPASQAAQAPASSEADVPDWLKQISSVPAPQSASEPEVPDWLKQPLPQPPSPVVSGEPELASEAETPDWLKQLGAVSTFPAVPAPQPTQPEAPRAVPLEPTPQAAPSEADVPDWLKQIAPTSLAGEAPEAFEAQAPESPTPTPLEAKEISEPETPAWLQDLTLPAEAAPAVSGPALVGAPAPEPAETLPWFTGLSEPEVPSPQAEVALPDWLKELEPQAAPQGPAAPPGEPPESVLEAVPEMPGELPDWLKELQPSETEAAPQAVFTGVPPAQPAPAPETGGLVAAQLPAWLQQLQPTGEGKKELEKEEPAESEGILAGLRGPLQVAPVVAQPFSGTPRPARAEIPAADLAHAGALQELLTRGPSVVIHRAGESRAQKLWANTQRWIVFAIILVFVLVPLLNEQLAPFLVSPPALGEAGNALYEALAKLNPNDRVLVAFDYDASQSPEMDTQARVVLRHLAARKANVQIVSLYPSGPAVAKVVAQTISGTIENRGYLAGQDIGIASIMTEPYAMVIEFAATPDTLRLWVEQLSARPGAPPLYAGVSAGAEPMSRAYYFGKRSDGTQQVSGLIVGVPDAAAYQLRLQKDVPGDLDTLARVLAPLASISFANVALVLLMAIGGLIQLAAGGKRK